MSFRNTSSSSLSVHPNFHFLIINYVFLFFCDVMTYIIELIYFSVRKGLIDPFSNMIGNHLSISELAYQFTLNEEQVLAALLYYREHKDEIDAQDAADAQESLDLHRRYGRKPGQS